jgi:regulator of RNase E activity RraA
MTVGFRINPIKKSADADSGLIAAFAKQAVSHLSDSMGRAQTAASVIRPMHGGVGILCGPALTVRVAPGDHLMVQKALDLANPGDVIVVDAGGLTEVAMIGDIMTTYAAQREIAGFVIDGAIRDLADIARRDLPVYARGVSPRGPTRVGPGEIYCAVCIGGMIVKYGDIIVGDADGLVAVPAEDAQTVLAAALKLREKEEDTFKAIAAGTFDRSWIDATLQQRGCAM